MSTIAIQMLRPDGSLAPNIYEGSPEVTVNVEIDSTRVLIGGRALIDTGADTSSIHKKHVRGCTAFGQLEFDTMNGKRRSAQYTALVVIDGLPQPQGVALVESDTRFDFILGRDMLRYYRLQISPNPIDCFLEEL